jgi:TetR/AcrR family transcriptional repressor of nem operon
VKRAFETVFCAMVSVLERSVRTDDRKAHSIAQATAALCIGGMVIARAMENRGAADALRDACMKAALEMGGWRKAKTSRRRKGLRRRVAT